MKAGGRASAASLGPHEQAWLAGAVILAAVLRLWGWPEIGIDHFDEGVYAFTALGWADATQPLRSYPDQLLFSPPLYPFLASLSYRLLGSAAASAVAVNVLLGVVTVWVLGSVGARWLGARAGVAAAWLLAVDPLHVMISRSALTDVTFLLLFLLALAAVVEAFRSGGWRWAILAGLLTGAAWNTKYHGWFVLLIAGWGLLASAWRAGTDRRAQARYGVLWLVMAGVATLCYLPWALHVHSEMGYGSFLAYQGSNVSGTWLANLTRQVGQQAFLESAFSRVGPALAALAVIATGGAPGARSRAAGLVVALAAAGIVIGQGGTTLLLLLLALGVGMRAGAPIHVWVLAGWTALWLASAPLYDPYARLLMPLWVAAALGSAWMLVRMLGAKGRPDPKVAERAAAWSPSRTRWTAVAIVVVVAVLAVWRERGRPQGAWRPADGMERAAVALAETVPEGSRVVVLGEPALAYYLHRLGRPAFERTDAPDQVAALEDTVFVVAGRYVRSAAFLRDRILDALTPRLETLDTVRVVPRDLRLLDDLAPSEASRYLTRPDSEFDAVLYRLHPAASP